jgi:Protein of unknown function (DUF4230)
MVDRDLKSDSAEHFERGRASVTSIGGRLPKFDTPTAEYPEVDPAPQQDLRSEPPTTGDDDRSGPPHDADGPHWSQLAADEPDSPAPPSRSTGAAARGFRALFWFVAAVGLALALVFGAQAVGWLPQLKNPFATQTTDRSQPVLLKSIQDLSRYVAAEGTFQEVIDVQQNNKYIPDFLLNDRVLFVANGTVEAYVDFTTVGQGAITESADHKTVQIKLPAPQLGKPSIDNKKSYVFATQKGLLNRLNDAFNGEPNKLQAVYVLAEDRIAAAARASELPQRAQENTRKTLEGMLHSLGYTTVTVTFTGT